VASIDSVNAAMVWSPEVAYKFNWVSDSTGLISIQISTIGLTYWFPLLIFSGVDVSSHLPTILRRSAMYASRIIGEKGKERTWQTNYWWRFSRAKGSGLSCTKTYRNSTSSGIPTTAFKCVRGRVVWYAKRRVHEKDAAILGCYLAKYTEGTIRS
jgi:hypothetical protein